MPDKAVKRAVSLPKDLADRVADTAQSRQQTYSGLIQEALIRYFEELRTRDLEKAYADYYAKPGNVEHEKEAVKDFWKHSAKTWPEH